MTTRFSAITLDLSRFPAPLAIRGLSYETFLAERRASLVERLMAAGLPYDVVSLETDPAVILQQDDAYRELLAYAAINDAVKAGLIAFASGTDLDHQGLTAALNLPFGLRDLMLRRELVEANGSTPAVMESDEEYRRRLLLSPEAAAAGTEGGYEFHALSADIRVMNANVWSPSPGQVNIAVQAREGLGEADSGLVAAVHTHLHRRDIKPLTDVVTVRSVKPRRYAISARVYARPGPDPAAVRTLVIDSLTSMAAARRIPARDVPMSAIVAAASVGPVDRVVLTEPLSDMIMDNGELAVCTGIDVEVRADVG